MPDQGLPRAYRLKIAPELNAGKRAALCELQAEWERVLPLAFNWFWQPFLRGGLLPKNPPRSGPRTTFPATRLVTSQKDLMAIAIEGQAKSWASNLKNLVARTVMRDAILASDPVLRRQLLWINAMRAWLLPYREQLALLASAPAKSGALESLTPAASRLMRKLVRRHIEMVRLPDPRQLPLQVNQLSAVMAKASRSTSFWAESWLRISTLTRGQKLALPVMANAYAAERGGRRAATFSLVPQVTTGSSSAPSTSSPPPGLMPEGTAPRCWASTWACATSCRRPKATCWARGSSSSSSATTPSCRPFRRGFKAPGSCALRSAAAIGCSSSACAGS